VLAASTQILAVHPKAKGGEVSDPSKIVVACQHRQVMSNAQLRQKGIDRSDLHTLPAASVPQTRRLNMIVPIRHHQGYRGEPVKNLIPGLRAGEPLQKLLQNETCRNDGFAISYSFDQSSDFACRRRRIAPERERPNACVHKKRQARVRSAL
jgi:hypothetical protein